MSNTKDIRDLEREIEELRQRLNEISKAVNYITNYQAEQARLMAEHWYRFILWVRPFVLLPYQKPATIPQLRRPDSPPVLPSENGSKEDWNNPARVNTAWTKAKK